MLHYRFKSSAQVVLVTLGGLILLALLFSITQPIGAALGAAVCMNSVHPLTDTAGKPVSIWSSIKWREVKDKKEKKLDVKWDDEIVKATALTRDGAIVHPSFTQTSAA